MLLFFLSVWMCHLSNSASQGTGGNLPVSLMNRWYGPSYQPKGWSSDDFLWVRLEHWGYDSDNAFEGSMIGLSIGVVLGIMRAITLDGVPHTEDETPCKTLISHVIGGLISGALIGLVYVFFKGHIVGGALKGVVIGGILGALVGVATKQNSQGIIYLATQGAQTLGSPTWPAKFEDCGGRWQSPINIETEKLIKKKTKKSLRFSNYTNIPDKIILQNSQHSIHLTGIWERPSGTPFVTGGPLENRYYYSQLHFHWGKTPDAGSEHKIDGKSFPVEMHVVHDRFLENPTNVTEEGDSNHLVVVSYMFELSNKNNPVLEPVLEACKRVRGNQKKSTEVRPFPLDDIVDPFHGDYVTYKGSLTTPPCTEGVIWIINSKPMQISTNQLKVLRNCVKNKKGDSFANNRLVQPVNGRKIYYIYC